MKVREYRKRRKPATCRPASPEYHTPWDVSALLPVRGLRVSRPWLIRKRHRACVYSACKQVDAGNIMSDSMLLSAADLASLAFFLAAWVFHALATDGRLFSRVSLTTAMNAQREAWMRTMARRELRMIDTGIMLGLQQGTAFFASSSLLAIGGCFALLGASDQVLAVLGDLPFAERSRPSGVRDQGDRADPASCLRLLQVRLVLPAVQLLLDPDRRGAGASRRSATQPAEIEHAVRRAAKMNILAGKHFNAGLRGIFFSIGYLGWFVGPLVFVLSTLLLLCVLVRRQFFSAARKAVLVDGGSA